MLKWIVLGVAVLIGIGALLGDDDKKKASGSAGAAHFEVIKGRCVTDPANAYLYVDVTVRNTGDKTGTFTGWPWRRYNDGTVNDSMMDAVMVDIPAHTTRQITERYNYNALEHELLECAMNGGSNGVKTSLRVL